MTAQIRPATVADVAGIFRVRLSVRENHLSLAQLAEMGITEASITQMIRAAPCAWVAVEGGAVIGFSMVDLEEGSLFAAFVLPLQEGRGLGKALVLAAEEALFGRHPVIWLETGAASRAAGFYRRLGWGHAQDIGEGDIRLEKRCG
ncbi:GNAT family N-acetyltransferase [Frigidibacter albus]|uniref:GNAT family N-acetyltransferase n=1 Tax=Frigidibacter albus TaxID=1465486 RepID=A0A6L8VCG9_9RHOB|nr:GNAT family N-acetyltransferase [Frigidibacter albus]MZQ88015.1 GNAT family N-acetyltransferase [Frigidibacter albus]NBE30311.1 GNAT family N-acetyltransferase [Frigidibacter albus]GGH48047.1 N-acetyltransferase GCN5 [Frigidibacter albus]